MKGWRGGKKTRAEIDEQERWMDKEVRKKWKDGKESEGQTK